MKKVLIAIDNLNMGGVATSLYNYLQCMSDQANYELLVFNDESIKIDEIPQNVRIIPTQKILHILGKKNKELIAESIILTAIRILLQIIAKYSNGVVSRNLIMPFIKEIGNYDLAIAYSQDDSWNNLSKGCIDFVIKKVKAIKKIGIIHCDYKMFGGYSSKQKKQYDALNYIACVSESCKRSFCECFPELRDKTIVCENFTNVEKVKYLALNAISFPSEYINFVSISRLSEEKGLYRTANVLLNLYVTGIENFSWTIVGDGPEYDKLNRFINNHGMQNKIILVGAKDNPYIYLKNADALLLTSFNEAAPMVFGECAALGVPVITTNTCSAIEMVQNKNRGIVIDNSYEGIMTILKSVLLGEIKLEKIQNCNDINAEAFEQAKMIITGER